MRDKSRSRRWTAYVLTGVVAGMIGLTFASVPLYRKFCQLTGYGGTPRTENVERSHEVLDNQVTVRFDANVNPDLPWRFQPVERQVTVRLGEEKLVHFIAQNRSDHAVTGQAIFSVTPDKAAQYFNKIQCFCFNEQTLAAGQEVSMPVLFYIDPALAEDKQANDVSVFTLSYTFYPAVDQVKTTQGAGGARAAAKDVGAGG